MHDNESYRVQVCAATALFLIFIVLYVAQSVWRSRPFQVRGEPAPAAIKLKPICSFNVFKQVARNRADGFVSGNGTWKRNSRGVPKHFQPEICRFRYNIHIPRREVLQCILRYHLRYVVFAGDSNSMRYFAAFQTLLTHIGAHCLPLQVDKSSAHTVDSAYYRVKGNNIGPLHVHDRDCSGCINKKIRCNIVSANISIILEVLVFEFTIDAEVTSFPTYRECLAKTASKWKPCRVTTTTQQFLLKEYLASTPPDLFVLFGNAHDSNRYTLQEHAMNLQTLANMFDIYLPPTTKLIWTSKPAEYMLKKPDIFRGPIYENGTMNIIQWLTAANKIQFQQLRKRFIDNGRPLMFLDLYGISAPVLRDWNIDGVHMQSPWYNHIISQILQVLCPV